MLIRGRKNQRKNHQQRDYNKLRWSLKIDTIHPYGLSYISGLKRQQSRTEDSSKKTKTKKCQET
jgi:hypothetical protein